jgi:hypothetical protein
MESVISNEWSDNCTRLTRHFAPKPTHAQIGGGSIVSLFQFDDMRHG